MSPQPPYFSQECSYSCVPACLRMVLASYGHTFSESELIEWCNTDAAGTSSIGAVEGLHENGFHDATREFLQLHELQTVLAKGAIPITLLKLRYGGVHAVVVTKITNEVVEVLDPDDSARSEFERKDFEEMWDLRNGETILIR